jgi:hypothetical protein
MWICEIFRGKQQAGKTHALYCYVVGGESERADLITPNLTDPPWVIHSGPHRQLRDRLGEITQVSPSSLQEVPDSQMRLTGDRIGLHVSSWRKTSSIFAKSPTIW